MNFIDFLTMGGQQRRRMLDEYVDDLNLERFVPPQLRPAAEFVGEANPVAAMGNAMQAGGVVFDPDATAEARKRAAVDMGVEMAMSLAPAALVRAGYLAAPAGLTEMFATPTGEVIGPMVRNAVSDVQYAGRSLAEGDLGGVLDVFRPSGQPQSVDAADVSFDSSGNPIFSKMPDGTPIQRASLFSPSLRAAENLKQNKGTYEQMRGMLLKGGAKDVELEWSGADRFFEGKKVTKDDLIKYLRANDPRLQETSLESYGKTGSNDYMDMDELVDRYVNDNIEVETEYYLSTYGPERVAAEYREIDDLDNWELEELADAEGYDSDQLADFIKDYEGFYVGQSGELFADYNAALADAFGTGSLDPEVAAESIARESLEENARYNMGEDELRDLVAPDELDQLFDPAETQYGDYFPAGAEDYSENIFQYVPEENTFPSERVAGASHFGEADEGAQFHTRTGFFPVRGTDRRAMYVGEIQSDAQQNINKPLLSYDEGVRLGELDEATNNLTNTANKYRIQQSDHYLSLKNELSRLEGNQHPKTRAMLQDLDNQAFLDTFNGDVGFSPRKSSADIDVNKKLPRLYSDLSADDFEILSKYKRAYISDYGRGMSPAQLADAAINHTDLVPDNYVGESVRDILAKHSAAGNYAGAYGKIAADQERFFLEDNPDITSDKLEGIGGPMMGSQNRWVDYALRSEIVNAVNNPNIDYLALPKDERAIGAVGGAYTPKQGAIDFYNRDVQNRLKSILKKVDPDARVEPVFLQSSGNQYIDDDFDAYGLRLTPEFRRRVKEQGLPTFAAFGAMPLLGVFDYLRDQKEKRNERMGGLMGYGGL